MSEALRQKVSSIPQDPGVYLMKDAKGKIFYVGKAKNLRNRLRNYLSGSDTRRFVSLLDQILADIEVVITNSEKEALIIENELIKQHRPRHNVRLVDDKRYLCLRLDTKHAYPRIEIRRKFGRDKAQYFGPYSSATAIRKTLNVINRYFQLRTCSDHVLNNRRRPCLQYQIKRCPAPCVYDLGDGEYARNVEAVVDFLEGRHEPLIERLERMMLEYSNETRFEEAAIVRDQIKAIRQSLEQQNVSSSDFANRDVIGFYREGPAAEFHVMVTRGGNLRDARRFSIDNNEQPTPELISDFASRYYQQSQDCPDEILFSDSIEWAEALEQLLTERAGHKVVIHTPQKGKKKKLTVLADRNAQQAYLDKVRTDKTARTAIERLQKALHLKLLPERIECFDISHFQGSQIVASAVCLVGGQPAKEHYRRYKIRTTEDQDDFQSMYEVISRRVRRGIEENDLPDLIVIDGGKGQLSAARAALNDHGVDTVDLLSLAKARTDRSKKGSPRNFERIFLDGRKNPIILGQNSAELFILMRARDEAHRFAITFQRQRQRKASKLSVLDDIPGIGPARKKTLLRHFGSLKRIRAASLSELEEVVGSSIARALNDNLPEEK
ncbi:MAG: excinuclease ABC subunit UvrC [Deltaproteobacteria bacterium]|jgi:excinuclease ABC subunit C|nr:excinuclease ABC subunit UvrC [Deltaproteobacteria bacterium]MBT6489671.1 excinuclease ABC subunit UvrC [Deltaproteobacteria bacterium]